MKLSGESIKKNRLMSVAAATLVVSTLTGAHTAKPSVNSPPKVEASATPETEQNLIFSPMFFG